MKQEAKAKFSEVLAIVKSNEFWRTAKCLVELSAPAMNLLRLADSDIPGTGKVYHEMFKTSKIHAAYAGWVTAQKWHESRESRRREALNFTEAPRREALLRDSARLGQPWHQPCRALSPGDRDLVPWCDTDLSLDSSVSGQVSGTRTSCRH